MQWQRLICDQRFGMEDAAVRKTAASTRSDFQRDYDRLVFSSPFRRLQNKTQVFPLPGSIFVHNRLTHSMEVACVGRSMAAQIVEKIQPRYHDNPDAAMALESCGEIVAAACLAHDLGNPPFGHSGERAIATFFSEGPGADLRQQLTPEQWSDLTRFEGNANALRLLTHQFVGRREGGFAMTYSTLASIVKYPYASSLAGTDGLGDKFGFFTSERDTYARIASHLGILSHGTDRYARHPLVFVVEAADDICYEVMDMEDAHKLKILDTDTVKEHFLAFFPDERRRRCQRAMTYIADPNEQVGYLRSSVIGTLVDCCAQAFADHEDEILAGTFSSHLLSLIPPTQRDAFAACNALSESRLYRAQEVVDVELAGNRIISFLLEKLIHAVRFPDLNYSRLLLSQVPQQYDVHSSDLFTKVQGVLDHVSAMTDVYALDLYRKLNGLSLPAV